MTAIFSIPARRMEMIKGEICTVVATVILATSTWQKPQLVVLDFFLAPARILFNKETLKIFPFFVLISIITSKWKEMQNPSASHESIEYLEISHSDNHQPVLIS